jgi:FKBP-type peptidyl-prolyl cis-trans isomerase FklB
MIKNIKVTALSLLIGTVLTGISTSAISATNASQNALSKSTSTPATTDANASDATPDMSKVSYLIGYQMGQTAKSQDVDLNPNSFSDGLNAGFASQASKYSDDDSKATMDAFQKYMENKMMNQQNQAADQNQKASDAYMAKIAQEPGVIKIADGLYYKVIQAGNGKIPTSKDTVKVNYEGSLINGTVFDSSYKRNSPISFGVNQVIPGWTQALQKMPVGSTWMVYIAPDLAYGKFAPPVIGPNQALVFKIELLGINT